MQATVLIFPDLNTGNNTYKAVQQVLSSALSCPIFETSFLVILWKTMSLVELHCKMMEISGLSIDFIVV